MGSFEPTPQQRRAMEDRGGSLLVSAAAGSGKTKVLVERLFGYMERERCRIDDFLIITFTKAAAAELRGRIAAELSQRVARQPENMHLRRQMMRVYQADIKTVDAFCGSLLRENIHLLPPEGQRSLTPDFRVLDQQEAELLRMQVLEQVLEEFYQRIGRGDTQAQQLAETLGAGRDDRALERLVLDIHGKIQSHAYPMRWLERLREQWQQVPESVGPYREVLTDSILRRTRFWAKKLTETAAWMEQYPDLYRGYGDRFLEMAEQLQGYEAAAQEGWDAMARLKPSFRRMGVVKGCDGAKEQAQAVRKRCKDELDEIGALLAVSESEQREDLEAMAPAMLALVRLTEDFTAAYQAEKVRRNCMDFSDQEHYAIRLLQGDDGAPTPLGRQLSGRYREIMVDEYQDTNEVQNCIFRAISRDGQNLFTVGDVKQSIYPFRLADPTIFLEKYLAYRPAEEAEEGQPRKVLLSQNFRSRRQVLSAANFVFGSIMSRQMGEMDYGPEERLNYGAAGYPERSDTDTEFHLISVADTEEERFDRTEVEARFVAHRIRQLLDEGFPVQGEDGQQRPVQPEDIVILMRSPAARRKAFTAALQREDIPCAGGEEQAFFETMEIAVMVSFLQIVDNPRQDVPLLAVLRSPLLGFTPDRLAQIRGGHPEGDYYAALCADDGEDSRVFLERLAQLRAAAGELTADRLLWKLYTDWQALAVFGAMEGGAQRRSNLLALYAYAGQLAAAGRGNLFDFVSYLHDLMESGDLPDISARQESGGVQLMTIHKSKGLEFHTVLIPFCDWKLENETYNQLVWCTAPEAPYNAIDLVPVNYSSTMAESVYRQDYLNERLQLWVDNLNLLYVAFTRAGKNLIVWSRKDQKGTMSELLSAALPQVAKAEEGSWDEEGSIYESGAVYPSEEALLHCVRKGKNKDADTPDGKSRTVNKLAQKPVKLPVHTESMRHDIEFRQSNRSADFIAGVDEAESGRRFINRGRLLHTLFSVIETEADIDDAVNRLVFEGIIGRAETEEEIRELTRKAFAQPQIKDWYSGTWQLFNECDIIWQENGELRNRRPDRVMMRDGAIVVVDFKFGKPNKKYNKQVQGYMELLVRMGYDANAISGYLWYVEEEIIEKV